MATINFPLLICLLTICCHFKTISSSRSSCSPSSCGKIERIGFPFRLKNDPANCGDRKFELRCLNDQLLLNLSSNIFQIEAIDYRNYTIRVVDPALDKTDPCSFSSSYTQKVGDYSDSLYSSEYSLSSSLNVPLAFVNCASPVNSSSYVDIGSCKNLSSGGLHSYVVEMSGMILSDLETSCGVDRVIPMADLGTTDFRSLSSIHVAAAAGFDLSWYYGMCPSCYGVCTVENEALVCHREDTCDDQFLGCNFQMFWSLYLVYYILIPLAALVGFRLLIGIPCIIFFIKYRNKRRHPFSDWQKVQEITKGQTQFKPIHYTYYEIKKMTNNFKQKLAEGVYRGKLRSGPLVAVKMVENSTVKKSAEFLTFLSAIGRTDHSNVMQLIGFCFEGQKRALVYDLMPNCSIQKYMSLNEADQFDSVSFSCEIQYKISLGVARGISYLHENSDTFLGFRPHNVLLDENMVPKISDFWTVKSVRAAPEFYYKGGGEVSQKSDVYSFGMMLVGMICRLKNVRSSSGIYEQMVEGNVEEMEISDASEEEKNMMKKMMRTASLCIQMNASDRPSMDEVVRMLEQENGGARYF